MPMPLLYIPALVLAMAVPAQAQDRYRDLPPVLIERQVAEPWIRQLRQTPPARSSVLQPARVSMPLPKPKPMPMPRQLAPEPEAVQPVHLPVPVDQPPRGQIDPKFFPATVDYDGPHSPGTIVIDTVQRFLYLVEEGGKARRYGVGVGKPGFEWAGMHRVTARREWPDWRPPAEMIAREKARGRDLPVHMKGGPNNPLGARALYLGSTLYRIHGTNQPWTIGHAVSSGCIRMRNEDVTELYDRVPVGTKVFVL